MLSKKTKYALKALIYLAKSDEKEPVLIVDIAEKEHIPRKFLETILLELRNHGYLGSKKGKGGGYYMKKDPALIRVVDLVRIMNGPIAYLPCVSLNFYEKCEECIDEKICGIRDVFVELRDKTLQILSENTLADLIKREDKLIKLEEGSGDTAVA